MSENAPVVEPKRIPRLIEILLVEDNPADIRLTREALKDSKTLNNLHVAMDGLDALAYLKREGEHANRPRPDLLLLDLNLPRAASALSPICAIFATMRWLTCFGWR